MKDIKCGGYRICDKCGLKYHSSKLHKCSMTPKEKAIEYKLTKEQLEPKDGKLWLEMVSLHKSIPKDYLKVPAELWYFFFVMGIEKGKQEALQEQANDIKEIIGLLMKEIIELPQPDTETATIQTIKINVLQELSERIDKHLGRARGD